MTELLIDNQDVMRSLMRALSDPGSITPRAPLESLTSWQRRAVIEFAAPYIGHAAALAEHKRIAGQVIPLLQAAGSHITDLQNALWNHASVELDDGPDLQAAIGELSGAES